MALIPGMLGKQHTADFFAADQADTRHIAATVYDVSVSKTKNGAKTYATVTWDDGEASDVIELSDSHDVRAGVPAGRRLPVVVWHRVIIRYESAGVRPTCRPPRPLPP